MFKKLLAKFRSPKNHGEDAPELENRRWIKAFDVVLANMEGAPSYPLSHQLTIGSEIGNIIINDPSVSPRHATILLQEEVLSIMDHGSVAGTLVNGTKITPGRFIILEESDTISVGDLEVQINVRTEEALEEDDTVPPELEEVVEEEPEEEEPSQNIEPSITKSKVYMGNANAPAPKPLPKPQKKKVSFSLPSYDAANSLIRAFAVGADLLLSYILINIFWPFDDFRNLLELIPTLLEETFDFKWSGIWLLISEELGTHTQTVIEVFQIINDIVPVLNLIIVFFLLRAITTLIFGVSLSELMFGMKANFNPIWARVGGLLRVMIGMITWPFLIFDIPSLASKRTFKEFITFTNTYVGSRVMLFVGIVFYGPLLLIALLVSPMIVGLELVEPVPFNSAISQRVKPKVTTQESVDTVVIPEEKFISNYLGMTLSIDPQKISLIPEFQLKGKSSKLNMKAGLNIFNRETEREVDLELVKTFDMKELLRLGLKGNFMLHEQFPGIYNYAYSSKEGPKLFKPSENIREEEQFGSQIVSFTEMAMSLSVDTLLDFMQTKTPFLKSVVDYRSALLGLIEYKNFTEISVVKLGKILCLRVSYDQQKPFDLIIPLMRGEGRVFKITFDRKEEVEQLKNDFYKFTLDDLEWGVTTASDTTEAYDALEVLDLFTMDIEKGKISEEKAQSLYGFYFEKSVEILKNGKVHEFESWKEALKSVTSMLPYLRESSEADAPEEDTIKTKLKSNFSDLMNAFEAKNMEFFGIQDTSTV